jgi:DNA invertase Pin-like site-specific DNA recombinase
MWILAPVFVYAEGSESGPSSCCQHGADPNLNNRCYRSPRLPACYPREPRPCEVPVKAAIYARVSTLDQEPENQLAELRRYVAARGWDAAVEYVDHGVSGAKDKRPALDRLMHATTRRQIDVVVCWRLDRLGTNLKHLVTMVDTWQHLGVAFVSLGEGIDCTTPAGTLQLHILAALAQFERARIVERVRAGIARAKAQGRRLGRQPYAIADAQFAAVADRSLPDAAQALGVSRSVVHRWRLSRKPLESGLEMTANASAISSVAA